MTVPHIIRRLAHACLFACMLLSLSSCFYQQQRTDAWDADPEEVDSLDFLNKHHYSVGYTFLVQTDSMQICTEIPSRAQLLSVVPDSLPVYKEDIIIVADICMVPEDEQDTVWIKVARDQQTQGWVRESTLLPSVSPDDPISLAIYKFSGNHVKGTLLLAGIVLFVFFIRQLFRYLLNVNSTPGSEKRSAPWLRIYSPYPTLLRLTLSGAAVFYASMQVFAPHTWTDFYFHPTLNPFAVSPLLGSFLFSIWLMLLFFMATADDAFRQLSHGKFILYMVLTVTVLAILYLFFSLTTLIFIGYPLYLAFAVYSVLRYFRRLRPLYSCGVCGKPMHKRGTCPHCGAKNE